MGRWSRDELEEEFEKYQAKMLRAGTTHNWREWADLFTEDATYVEHHHGRFGGREANYNLFEKIMNESPNVATVHFPVDWYVIDDERGWVVCKVKHRLADPGDGSIHESSVLLRLKYAGKGTWNYAEDIYNPSARAKTYEQYLTHKEQTSKSS